MDSSVLLRKSPAGRSFEITEVDESVGEHAIAIATMRQRTP